MNLTASNHPTTQGGGPTRRNLTTDAARLAPLSDSVERGPSTLREGRDAR